MFSENDELLYAVVVTFTHKTFNKRDPLPAKTKKIFKYFLIVLYLAQDTSSFQTFLNNSGTTL